MLLIFLEVEGPEGPLGYDMEHWVVFSNMLLVASTLIVVVDNHHLTRIVTKLINLVLPLLPGRSTAPEPVHPRHAVSASNGHE